MKIKITEKNLDAVQAALDAANGRARAHTFDALELLRLAQGAEQDMERLGIPSRLRSGAKTEALSGSRLAKAYTGRVIRTTAIITRGSRDWFLAYAQASEWWPDMLPYRHLLLTLAQDEAAHAHLRKAYRIQGGNAKPFAPQGA